MTADKAIIRTLTKDEADLALRAFLTDKGYRIMTHPYGWARWDDLPRPCWSVWVAAHRKDMSVITLGIQIYDGGDIAITFKGAL